MLDEPGSEVAAAIKQLATKFASSAPAAGDELALVNAGSDDKKKKRGLFSRK